MLRGPCCPAYPFLWSCRLCARVRYHLGQAQWSSLLPILCCLPRPSFWTKSLSTLPAVFSQCPVNKLQLSVHLHLGPISCRSLTVRAYAALIIISLVSINSSYSIFDKSFALSKIKQLCICLFFYFVFLSEILNTKRTLCKCYCVH